MNGRQLVLTACAKLASATCNGASGWSRFLMELHQGRTFCLLKLAIYVLFAIVCSGAGRRDFHGTIAAIATGLVYAA
ncbi:hypothetical protein AMC84_PC00289 (plasmid) [Rhizobium phaseoli]|uniref:Uncharacterized protein n=2 Tax=Rhizobium TaxID=379 RepID=A0A4R3Q4Q0_9HYPH|nr:hypothetical protein AMC84_PC00289 [Rhizobium phaseoli]ANM13793.1 hypothetical protein AMK05_PC00279 [Rhizobium sp. N324]ANM20175.1 hypothetical protein AMK06_PC100265 [Rhizobium sp. N541]ANM26560.1 hypothetical protein AMK07_PC100265 [Rhizobium sp. N941]MBB5668135.1 hypothetical protein [Rhizobium leguminosarum]OWV75786.1 hypothetical protein ATY75_29780 [Rhizobium sp. N122]OYD00828.1 hypothetical protein AMK08_PC00281 [Rhizobium sp. N4311]TCU16173.1 hypothetical protein EV130_11937 [Rhi